MNVPEALPISAIAHLVRTERSAAERRRIIARMACEIPWDVGLGVLHELAGTAPAAGLCRTATVERPVLDRRHEGGRRGPGHRWTSPPPLAIGEQIDGNHVLEDYDGQLGIVLWQSVRDVLLWASTPHECRVGLFHEEALTRRHAVLDSLDLRPQLDVWLTALSAVLIAPAEASSVAIATACVELSRTAAAEGRSAAALSLASSAVAALPVNAAAAYEVARAALTSGDHYRAETWLRWALHLARRSGDGATFGAAALDFGHLELNRGEGERARRYFKVAARRGRDGGLISTRAGAAWGLYLVAMRLGPLERAERYAMQSVKLFGAYHPEVAPMQLDLAALRIRLGKAREAQSLLKRVLRHSITPPLRPRALALLSHAAASLRDRRTYARAWTDAASLIQQAESSAAVVEELTRAARAAGDTHRVRVAEQLGAAPQPSSAGSDRRT